jgi:Flp pilus assembly protein TadG
MLFRSPIRAAGALRNFMASLFGSGEGSQIAEFAISAPVLIVLAVGIFDFSGAFTLKEKIMSAAQQGSDLAANQATVDLGNTNPDSVSAARDAIFNYLANEKILPNANVGACVPASAALSHPASSLSWSYTISGCGYVVSDALVITIDRGYVFTSGAGNVAVASSHVTISYPYHWEFDRVVGLVAPAASYAPTTQISADAIAQNQS